MVLGIAEDFTSDFTPDSELTALPSSGLFLNVGVHPSITVENLLAFLPLLEITPAAWSGATTYGNYSVSRKRSDLVTKSGIIYQSLKTGNLNQDPATETNYWLATDLDSLRIKSFFSKVKDRVFSDLHLTKRLVNNQYLYERVREDAQEVTLPGNYAAWVFEAKGSDYVTFRINQGSLAKSGTAPVNLYVINQNELIDTLTITPSNGKVEFKPMDYVFSGTGQWKFVIDSTTVFTNNSVIDPLKYDGFMCCTAVGIGDDPQTAKYSLQTTSNGLGFNVSVYLDSTAYIENNVSEFGNLIRATFELMTLQMFLHNSNNKSNAAQRIQADRELLVAETKSLEMNTVAKRYQYELSAARKIINKTFDTQLFSGDQDDCLTIEVT